MVTAAKRSRDRNGRYLPAEDKAANWPIDTSFFQSLTLRQDSPLTNAYSQHGWVYAAMRTISREMSGVPLLVKRPRGDTPRMRRLAINNRAWKLRQPVGPESEDQIGEVVQDLLDPVYAVFRRPNPFMMRTQLIEYTALYLAQSGACMWLKRNKSGNLVTSPSEVPTELWPVDGDAYKPHVDPMTGLPDYWEGNFGSLQLKVQPHQGIWFRLADPSSYLGSVGPMEVAKMAADGDYQAAVFNKAFFENGADPGGIIKTKANMTPERARTLIEVWEDRHRGPGRHQRTAVLGGDAEYIRNGVTQQDMQFKELRTQARDEILAIFGVPKILVGLVEDHNRATAQAAKSVLFEDTLLPMMGYIEDVLEMEVAEWKRAENYWLEFAIHTVEALRENSLEKASAASTFFNMGFPLNQINEKLQLGFDPVKHGDTSFLPLNLAPAEDVIAGDVGGDEDLLPPDEEEDEEEQPETEEEDEPEQAASMRAATDDPRWVAHVRGVLDPMELRAFRQIRKYLYQLRRNVMERIGKEILGQEKAHVPDDLMERILFARDRWNRAIQDMMDPIYSATARETLRRLSAEVGGLSHVDATHPEIVEQLVRKRLIIRDLNDRMRERLRKALVEAAAEHAGVDATAEQVAESLRKATRQTFGSVSRRALTIARTEVAQAASVVRNIALAAEGIQRHRWLTAGDEHVRDGGTGSRGNHRQNNGVVRNIGEPFPNGLHFPNEPGAPPHEIINCRCVAVAVRDDETE